MQDFIARLCCFLAATTLAILPCLSAPPHLSVVARKNVPAGGGGSSPGTTNMVAAYDFNNTTPGEGNDDSHSTYDLTEVSSPTYQTASAPEYGIAAATATKWSQADLDDAWSAVTGDKAYAMRWRGYTGFTSGVVLECGGDRFNVSVNAGDGDIDVEIGNIVVDTGVAYVEGTWFCIVASLDNDTGNVNVWVNGSNFTGSGTASFSAGGFDIGGRNTAGVNVDVDYFYAFSAELTADNAGWIYNSGGTRNYADF